MFPGRYGYSLPATLSLLAMPAFASGREGEGLVGAVQLIVGSAVALLVVSLVGGIVVGARKAHRDGESISRGAASGVLKGIVAFVIACAVVAIVVSFAGVAFIAFSLFTAPLATPSSP